MSCGVGRRHGSDPALLWLWCRLVAAALIRPLAWEPPCAAGAAQEMAKRQKKKKTKETRKLLEIPGGHRLQCLGSPLYQNQGKREEKLKALILRLERRGYNSCRG